MRVITLNANGIRAAARKGFYNWLRRQKADFVCLQELKAQEDQLQGREFWPRNWHCFLRMRGDARAIRAWGLYSRREPDDVLRGYGSAEFDAEGRYLEARFGKLERSVAVPALGVIVGRTPGGQVAVFFDEFTPLLAAARDSGRQYSALRRFQPLRTARSTSRTGAAIARTRVSFPRSAPGWTCCSANWGSWTALGGINPEPDQYTWWSNRGQAWAKKRGLAHRLPRGHAGAGRARRDFRLNLQAQAFLRPRAADPRLCRLTFARYMRWRRFRKLTHADGNHREAADRSAQPGGLR